MATLAGAEIFATGTHNGLSFGEDDLDAIVQAFDALGLAGRIPLKFGHNVEQPMTDGQPSLGWVERIWREGKKLLADFRDVPAVVYEAIRNGRYKHVSVELLRDVRSDSRIVPLVLDAVALLGADIPAVGSLRDLQSLALTRLRGTERLVFAQAFAAVPSDELADLRRENERLRLANHRQAVDAAIEGDVRARLVLPAAREQFTRLFRLSSDADYQRVSVGDWHTFRGSQPRPLPSGPATHTTTEDTVVATAPDAALVAKVHEYLRENELRHLQLTGERLSFGRAAQIVARANPALLEQWRLQNGETD